MAKEGLTPEVLPPTDAAARNRAYRLKKAIAEGGAVPPEDLTWLTEYEKGKQSRSAARSKKVTYSSEETESAASGDAAHLAAALAAPQLAREEGRRIDSLIREATNATTNANKMTLAACEVMMKFATAILDRNGKLEQNNVAMLDTFRKSHIELTHAHSALIHQQAEHEADEITRDAEEAAQAAVEKDGVSSLVEQFMPVIMKEIAARSGGGK